MAGTGRPLTVGELVSILNGLPEDATVVIKVNAHYSSTTISGFHGMSNDYTGHPIAVFCEDCEGEPHGQKEAGP